MRSKIFNHRWFFLCTVVLFAATPWLIGTVIKPETWDHLPTFVMAAGDTPVYFRYIDEGRHGGPFMIDGLTTEEHPAILWQPIWWILGRIAELFGLTSATAFALGRIFGAALLAWVVAWAARQVFEDKATQVVARWIGFFGAGVGGLLFFLLGPWILADLRVYDLWVSEGYAWMSSLASPHFLFVTSGLLFVFIATEFSHPQSRVQRWVGPALLLTVSVHPFHLPTILSAWLVMSVFDRLWRPSEAAHRLRQRLLAGLWTLPALLFYGLTYGESIVSVRAAQNINPTSWWPLVLGLLPLIIGATVTMFSQERVKTWPLAVWSLAILGLVFFPFDFQRRLFEPPAILLGFIMAPTVTRLLRGNLWSFLGGAVVMAAMLFSPILVFGKQINHILTDRRTAATTLAFMQPAAKEIVRRIQANGTGHTFLAGQVNSLVIGSFSPLRPYYAHGVETLDSYNKRATVDRFYRSMTAAEQITFLEKNRICFVIISPYERAYGPAFSGSGWDGLRLEYRRDNYDLYATGICDRHDASILN